MISYVIVAVVSATLGAVVVALLAGGKKRDDDLFAASNEFDALRIDFVENSKSTLTYNETLKSWGVLAEDMRFSYAAPSLRAALDGARHRPTKTP